MSAELPGIRLSNPDLMTIPGALHALTIHARRLSRVSGFEFVDSYRFFKSRSTAFESESDLFEVTNLRKGMFLVTDHKPAKKVKISGDQVHYLMTNRQVTSMDTNGVDFNGGLLDFPIGIYGDFAFNERLELARIMALHEGGMQIFASHTRDEQTSADYRARTAINRLTELFNKIELNSA